MTVGMTGEKTQDFHLELDDFPFHYDRPGSEMTEETKRFKIFCGKKMPAKLNACSLIPNAPRPDT